MALTEQQKYLAGKIDKHVYKIPSRGGGDEAILLSAAKHMDTFKRLMDNSTEAKMQELCESYEGFYRFARLMESLAQGISDGSIEVA
ncbi:MAG: arylsulfatase regulator [Pseudomonadales bacterium]|nr:arylsulfatase regulator [Pseudomonadales bacterium]